MQVLVPPLAFRTQESAPQGPVEKTSPVIANLPSGRTAMSEQ